MKTMPKDYRRRKCGAAAALRWLCGGLTALALGAAAPLQAQIAVSTLGGGPIASGGSTTGTTDGNTYLWSQFNGPVGLALDPDGETLYIADQKNNRVRQVTQVGDQNASETGTYKILPNNPNKAPVSVAVDAATNVYVLTQQDGRLTKYNLFGELVGVLATNFTLPTVMVMKDTNTFFVAQTNGAIWKLVLTNGLTLVTNTQIGNGFKGPQGLALLKDETLAVSDTMSHTIRVLDPNNGLTNAAASCRILAGVHNAPGRISGTLGNGKLNQPHRIVQANNGTLVVADRMNHRVCLVSTNGTILPLYGIEPNLWNVVSPDYPGWADGSTNAACREPVGLALMKNGDLLVTELKYHILRVVRGAGLIPVGGGGGSTNALPDPVLNPNSGYYPNGIDVQVDTGGNPTYYTTDGTEPTTNSMLVVNGVIPWNESLKDLTWLWVKAIASTNESSSTVSGVSPTTNTMVIPRDIEVGAGGTAVVPVVINLKSNVTLKSYELGVKVTPVTGPLLTSKLRMLPMETNDFIALAGGTAEGGGSMAILADDNYDTPTSRRLLIKTMSVIEMGKFGIAILVAVPIPATAVEGATYRVEVESPSGTSDGIDKSIDFSPTTNRWITVRQRSYVVGDTSPRVWYNQAAGSQAFGDGNIDNADVNNAMYASLGVRVPFPFSDAYNAMDAWPEDRLGRVGGDGDIRFHDWFTLFLRSLRVSTNNWARYSTVDAYGFRLQVTPTNLAPASVIPASSALNLASGSAGEQPGLVWYSQVLLSGLDVSGKLPGDHCDVPVYVKMRAGCRLSGMQFRASLVPENGAPPVETLVEFKPAAGVPAGQLPASLPGEALCRWLLNAFGSGLQGSNLVGWIRFTLPATAALGQSYQVKFSRADGGLDLVTPYTFETCPARVWLGPAGVSVRDVIPDEWRLRFFGSAANALADAEVDADGDGLSNREEYFAGTNPCDRESRLSLLARPAAAFEGKGAVLRWLTAPGKTYRVEGSTDLSGSPWTVVLTNVMGDGQWRECTDPNPNSTARFYRVQVQP